MYINCPYLEGGHKLYIYLLMKESVQIKITISLVYGMCFGNIFFQKNCNDEIL